MNRHPFLKLLKTSFLILLLLVATGAACRKKETAPTEQEQMTLTIWRAADDADAFAGIIEQFKQEVAPQVQINYLQKPEWKENLALYEEEAVNALATGRGPDIWSIKNDWIARHSQKGLPAAEELFTKGAPKGTPQLSNADYVKSVFVPVVASENIVGEKLIGLPLSVDSLALYYNPTIFEAALEELTAKQRAKPSLSQEELLLKRKLLSSAPQDWKQILELVRLITIRADNNVSRPALAMGTAKNIKNAPEILQTLMLQNGTQIVSADLRSASFNLEQGGVASPAFPGRDALRFYARFSNPSDSLYTWNNSLPDAEEAFVGGRLAMLIADSELLPKIKKSNPTLRFEIAPLPQINVTEPISLASYWTEMVTTNSRNPDLAWQFLAYASSQKGVRSYLANTKRPAALRSQGQTGNVFQDQAQIATSFYKGSQPLEFDRLFQEMIEAVVTEKRPLEEAINSAASKITSLLSAQQPLSE